MCFKSEIVPCFWNVLEDESHLLFSCPVYAHVGHNYYGEFTEHSVELSLSALCENSDGLERKEVVGGRDREKKRKREGVG